MTPDTKFSIWRDHPRRKPRIIDDYLAEFLMLLEQNQVVIVQAETGTGKTSRLPQYLLLWTEGMIYVTQPRRKAVVWNAEHVANEMEVAAGDLVGWRLRGEPPVLSDRTRCIFRVDQSLLNMINRLGSLPEGVIVVDEAHERHISTDALLILIKMYLPSSPRTKVVITSATFDPLKFSNFFWGAPILPVPGKTYPVEVVPIRLGKGEHHSEGAFRATQDTITDFLAGSLSIPTEDGSGRARVSQGTCLVLLPGEEDIIKGIETTKKWMRQTHPDFPAVCHSDLEKDDAKCAEPHLEIFACHSKGEEQEMKWAQGQDVPPGCLRVIFATEIARSSVTFPQMVVVVDSLQIKRRIEDINGAYNLVKIPVSQAESRQGAGRVGRTQGGIYKPVSFRNEYEHLEEWPLPAIQRESITAVTLQFVSLGIDPRTCDYLDHPGKNRVEKAMVRLQKIDALDECEMITSLGKQLLTLGGDPEMAKALVVANQLGVLPEAVIAKASHEVGSPFDLPRKDVKTALVSQEVMDLLLERYEIKGPINWALRRMDGLWEIYLDRSPFKYGARDVAKIVRRIWAPDQSDFQALVRAYREYMVQKSELKAKHHGKFKGAEIIGKGLTAWCQRHFLSVHRLRLMERSIRLQAAEIKESPFMNLKIKQIDQLREYFSGDLTKSLLSGLMDLIGVRVRPTRGPIKFLSTCGRYELTHHSACPDADLAMASGIRKITTGGTGFYYLADMVAPVEEEWLAEILPRLFDVLTDEPVMIPETGEVFVVNTTTFNGIEIRQDPIQVTDPEIIARVSREFVVIVLNGQRYVVDFQEDSSPVIAVLDLKQAIQLPDTGVFLPDGRPVNVTVKIEDGNLETSTNIPLLKKRIRNQVNQSKFKDWLRPRLSIPNPSDPTARFPEIVTVPYGSCELDGSQLMAYGGLYVLDGETTFLPTWSQDLNETLTELHNQARGIFGQLQSALAKLARRETKRLTPVQAQLAKAKALWPALDQDLTSLIHGLGVFGRATRDQKIRAGYLRTDFSRSEDAGNGSNCLEICKTAHRLISKFKPMDPLDLTLSFAGQEPKMQERHVEPSQVAPQSQRVDLSVLVTKFQNK